MLRVLFLTFAFLCTCAVGFAQRAWLAGISGRTQIGADGAWAYVTVDPAGGSRTVYISAAGPGLAALGVQGALSDPQLQVWDQSGVLVASNDDRDPALLNDFNYSSSARAAKDAGLKLTLAPGVYYVHVSGVSGSTGLCLIEITDPGVNPTLSTIAVRARLSAATETYGVTLYGTGNLANISLATFLTGPNLLVTNPVANPKLRIFSGSSVVSTIPTWQGFMPIQTGQLYRSPVTNDNRNAGFSFLWSIGSGVSPNLPPTLEVSDEGGGTSGAFLLEVHNADVTTTRPPIAYLTSPDTTVVEGNPLPLSAVIGGDLSQVIWQRNGVDIPGSGPSLVVLNTSTSFTVTLPSVTTADTGTYRLRMTSSTGAVSYSPPVAVTVRMAAPAISAQPQSATVKAGSATSLSVTATGGGLAYQWFKDGATINGATSATLNFAALTPADSGSYTVSVTNTAGTILSHPAVLTVEAASARLTNLSVRGQAGLGERTLILGFVLSGTSKPLLLRAIGPGLASFGVTGFLPDPRLGLYKDDVEFLANDNWTGADGRELGGFGLVAGSKDSVVSSSFAARSYTAQVGSVTGVPGEALVELYDGAMDDVSTRLVNLSSRTQLDAGQRLIVGMTITGTGSKTLILRAVGPTLANFGLTTAHPDPFIELYDASSRKIAENDQWSGDDGHAVGAFPLVAASKDAVLVRALSAGSYTLHVLGTGSTSGVVLVELYEVP